MYISAVLLKKLRVISDQIHCDKKSTSVFLYHMVFFSRLFTLLWRELHRKWGASYVIKWSTVVSPIGNAHRTCIVVLNVEQRLRSSRRERKCSGRGSRKNSFWLIQLSSALKCFFVLMTYFVAQLRVTFSSFNWTFTNAFNPPYLRTDFLNYDGFLKCYFLLIILIAFLFWPVLWSLQEVRDSQRTIKLSVCVWTTADVIFCRKYLGSTE